MSKNRPIEELKIGRVRAAVWKNESESGPYFSVTFSKLYKDQEGNWKDTTSYTRDDLMLVAKVADMAHTWLFTHNGEGQAKETKAGGGE
jgi:hypothetical protein